LVDLVYTVYTVYLVYSVYLVHLVYLAPFISGSHGLQADMGEFFHLRQSNI